MHFDMEFWGPVNGYIVKGGLWMITAEEVIAYAEENGAACAYDLLIMFGPDGFAGTYEEFENLLIELERSEL